MRSRLLRWGLLVSLLFVSPLQTAQARDDYARTGWHVGGLGVVAVPTWQDTLEAASVPTTGVGLSASGGIDLRGGYRLNARVALETGFEWIAAYRIEQSGVQVSQANNWMYYADAKVFILTGRTQPFLLLGMGAYHLDYVPPGRSPSVPADASFITDATAFAPRIGGGLEFYFTEKIMLTSEINYVLGTGKLHQRDRLGLSVGMFYRF